ncbi:LuxR family transcriptional regulator [Longispora fulva]|uniref:DNA-binding CsgD family transcriptional regulator n=1 Tax=Longispora fulva TaxID=619741 RepID=A0A8J7KVZ7_9ACTN|nr:LuxR family transcriptional regulator [Longispora fulva]MBG6135932.1 DNA-binding CsgD family transcriptional regulator [Longispora fulva]GIG55824.1 LuxR family transcriptional regulator [Longispora fulva]
MPLSSPVLVGREHELGVLARALGDMVSSGTGSTVILLGEAGSGKTRLASELQGRASMPVLRGRAGSTVLSVPYRPLSEALMSAFRTTGPPTGPALEPFLPVLGRLVPQWGHLADPGRADSPLVVAESVLRLLGVGHPAGCLLVLEDLHDADPETLAAVEYLMDNVDQWPVLSLLTARDQPGPARELFASARRRRVARPVSLGPLEPAHMAELAAHCLGGRPPPSVIATLVRDGDGNPFFLEELLAGMVSSGGLRRDAHGWAAADTTVGAIPATLAQLITERAEALGPDILHLLRAGALVDRRFPASVPAEATGRTAAEVDQLLGAACAAGILTAEPTPGWFAFRHALTVEVLLASLPRTLGETLAATVAAAIEHHFPGLPGEWCERVARLRVLAADLGSAAEILAVAGRRALTAGTATTAVSLFERAVELVGADRSEFLDPLLRAWTMSGRGDNALGYSDAVDGLVAAPAVLAGLQLRLAEAASATGAREVCLARIGAGRALLAAEPHAEYEAGFDVLESLVLVETPEAPPGRAEYLARRAAVTAEHAGLPELACRAWEVLGTTARDGSLAESDEVFELLLATAQRHELGAWQLEALAYLGANDMLRDGHGGRLDQAHAQAVRLGALRDLCGVEGLQAMLAVLRGEHDRAAELIVPGRQLAARLGHHKIVRYLTLSSAVRAGHRGRRAEMDRHVEALMADGGADTHYLPVAWGQGGAVCALLEEDRARARADLDRATAREEATGSPYALSGRYGLALLLGVLDGDQGWVEHDAVAAHPRSRYRWNRQFVSAARAVLLARDGRPAEAGAALAESDEAAAVFPLARHLVLRLVAEDGVTTGWGDPPAWARTAEEYFHDLGHRPVAAACRSVLRAAGAPTPARRRGWGSVPPPLRARGVTVREFEVLGLLAGQLDNRAVGRRLFISPRTVEKHVSGLLAKLECQDRRALARYASANGIPFLAVS